ncbi:MAG TPA: PhzF family phenazine biosynthesis protein [Phycisphaerae bacterium]|nr:PhzF family phenazine biosynthesis protein [Phycisphaerae bacterium]
MTTPLIQVDAFTSEPFGGNPAAVCVLREEAAEAWMQSIATEMNLSETAFVVPRGPNDFGLRWFTPTVEVPLCGHATLASAHALWEEKLASPDEPITFHTQSGRLTAGRESDWICLDFPALPVEECTLPLGITEALGARPLGVYRDSFHKYLVEVGSEDVVRNLQPDPAKLLGAGMDACIVTAPSDSGACDFVSRFFAPGLGIDEDPVTGAAHCTLTPFWSQRLGKTELVGHQVSKRGGVVKVRARGDRVDLLGQAVTVMRGRIMA